MCSEGPRQFRNDKGHSSSFGTFPKVLAHSCQEPEAKTKYMFYSTVHSVKHLFIHLANSVTWSLSKLVICARRHGRLRGSRGWHHTASVYGKFTFLVEAYFCRLQAFLFISPFYGFFSPLLPWLLLGFFFPSFCLFPCILLWKFSILFLYFE